MSLGQGQEPVAQRALEVAAEQGHWVILQVGGEHCCQPWLRVSLGSHIPGVPTDTSAVSGMAQAQAVPAEALLPCSGALAIMHSRSLSPCSHWVQACLSGTGEFLLQNIHLVARWLRTLDKIVEQHSTGSHNDYRLFMSAEPAPTPESHIIPQGLLENSIKITNEPPTGMFANLHNALDLFTQVPATAHSCQVCVGLTLALVPWAEHQRGHRCRHRSWPTPAHPAVCPEPHLWGCDLGVTRDDPRLLNQGGCWMSCAFPKAGCRAAAAWCHE